MRKYLERCLVFLAFLAVVMLLITKVYAPKLWNKLFTPPVSSKQFVPDDVRLIYKGYKRTLDNEALLRSRCLPHEQWLADEIIETAKREKSRFELSYPELID